MSRQRGTYSTVENWVLEVAPTLKGVAGWVLVKIAAQANYKRKTITIGGLMDSLGYDVRTLTKACAFLEQEGYVLCANGEHVLRGACTNLAQGVNKARASLANQSVSQSRKTGIYSEIAVHNKKEEEGIQKEEEKGLKNPPTPQGGEAQKSTAPVSPEQESFPEQRESEQHISPNGEAADAADSDVASSQNANQAHSDAQESNAATTEKFPRRAAKAAAPAFDPLSLALPACVPADIWADWCDHRASGKHPMTERAAKLTLKGLEVAHENGWDVTDILSTAIMRGWTGCIFEQHRAPNPRPAHVVPFSPPQSGRQPTRAAAPDFAQHTPQTREEWLS